MPPLSTPPRAARFWAWVESDCRELRQSVAWQMTLAVTMSWVYRGSLAETTGPHRCGRGHAPRRVSDWPLSQCCFDVCGDSEVDGAKGFSLCARSTESHTISHHSQSGVALQRWPDISRISPGMGPERALPQPEFSFGQCRMDEAHWPGSGTPYFPVTGG